MPCKKEAPSGEGFICRQYNFTYIHITIFLLALKTFFVRDRHTLWKRVQAVVVPLLAQLVSVIDRDQNMNILLDRNCGESVKRLWLDIFGDDKLLEISQLTLDHK